MKQNVMMFFLILSLLLLSVHLFYIFYSGKKIDRKYKITYPHGSSTFWDYTDTFYIEGNVIYYVDEHNNQVIRSGTYGVKKVLK